SDTSGGCASSGVQHQQQLDQILLHRGNNWLNNEDVRFAAVGFQLHAKTIVTKPGNTGRAKSDFEMATNLPRQFHVRTPAKSYDCSHNCLFIFPSRKNSSG